MRRVVRYGVAVALVLAATWLALHWPEPQRWVAVVLYGLGFHLALVPALDRRHGRRAAR